MGHRITTHNAIVRAHEEKLLIVYIPNETWYIYTAAISEYSPVSAFSGDFECAYSIRNFNSNGACYVA